MSSILHVYSTLPKIDEFYTTCIQYFTKIDEFYTTCIQYFTKMSSILHVYSTLQR